MNEYNPQEFEKRWQDTWENNGLNRTDIKSEKEKFYALVMFPYPSGTIHVGHVKNYVIGDVVARYKRHKGFNVLNPFGFDSFGLPAENAAIANNIHPGIWTRKNVETITKQIKKLGISYDWEKQVSTCEEDYYRWTQYIFLKLYENGLAYRKNAAVNWCPKCNTVLANEQVKDGCCERCGSVVELRQLEQWFFKITDYAERLLEDLDGLDEWPEHVKTMQRNWIGKSKGAEVRFEIDGENKTLEVFTTRPDTLWGVTFMALAPESPLVQELTADDRKEEVEEFLEKMTKEDRFTRASEEAEKEGVFLGKYAVNPVNGEKIPIYVANYILMEYGTGAIMAVPAHDQRDFDFARKYGIPINVVIEDPENPGSSDQMLKPFTGTGIMVNSGKFSGMPSDQSLAKVIQWLEEKQLGKSSIQYKLRDWLISRQRYWGAPIPMIYCEECGMVPVSENDLPVKLPHDVNFDSSGKSPLTTNGSFLNATCPKCGGKARREVDTMDTFVDSSWYYLRYINPKDENKPFETEDVNRWLPVDQYIGGVEHAILHLLYSRFLTKVLYDLKLIDFKEPFKNLFTQGMIYKDGFKMSKSKGNVVSPDEMVEEYGADTLRVYSLFIGPPEKDAEWTDSGIEGVHRFIKRIWTSFQVIIESANANSLGEHKTAKADKELRRKLHWMIEKITRDIEVDFHFNTAISGMMEMSNELHRYLNEIPREEWDMGLLGEVIEKFSVILSPFAPHLAEEIWSLSGKSGLVVEQKWPEVDPAALEVDEVEIIIQVNGKLRDKISVGKGENRDTLESIAMSSENVQRHLEGKIPRKVIVIPDKLVNIVL